MDLSRIPFFTAVGLLVSLLVLVVSEALLYLRDRVSGRVARGMCVAGLVLAIASCPVLFFVLTEPAIRAARAHSLWIDPPPFGLVSVALVVLVLISSRVLFPERGSALAALRWRIAFAFLIVGFIVLNVANWCSPGWCERFGFPFPYQWWSDAIIVVNGENFTAGTSRLAALGNLLVLVLGVLALSLSYRRRRARVAALSDSP